MLKEELEEMKKEHPEGLHTQTGACIFCGQIAQIETLFPWPDEKCNEAATELCDCLDAHTYIQNKKRFKKACKSIEEQFKNQKEMVRAELKRLAKFIIENEIEAATMKIDGNLTAKISATAKGRVKVEQTQKKKTSEEI